MKNFRYLLAAILLSWTFSSLTAQESLQKSQAKAGEKVWVIVLTVKNEHKANFEKWINEVMYPLLRNSKDKMRQDQLKSVRWLKPASQNTDQTWTYAWIMDPVVTGADYDLTVLLNQGYGEEKGKKHWEAYLSFLAKEPEQISLIQTNY